jgi:hypothetical protein
MLDSYSACCKCQKNRKPSFQIATHLLSLRSLTSGSPVDITGAGKLTDLTSWKMRMAGARDRADSAYNPSLHKSAMSQRYVWQSFIKGGDFLGFFSFYVLYYNQHCFICCPSDSTVSEDAGIEPRTVATTALAVRCSNHSARSHP